jgi:hypothetical protein
MITTNAEKNKIPKIIGVSRAIIESKANVPRPGHEKTDSTNTAPETTAENCKPAKVITGDNEFFNPCL